MHERTSSIALKTILCLNRRSSLEFNCLVKYFNSGKLVLRDDVMNRLKNKVKVLMIFGMATVGISEKVSAEYYISAFDSGDAFNQLMDRDSTAAQQVLSKSRLAHHDYANSNNLCVSQILSTEYAVAIDSCEKAIAKVPSRTSYNTRTKKSHIYTNLAVAKALYGDRDGAMIDLRKSLALDRRNTNASQNYDLLSQYQLVN